MTNPHNWLSKIDYNKLIWKCNYCGATGTLEELDQIECSYNYPPCKWCGQTCAPDCIGVRLALSDPNIYICGQDIEEVL